MFFLLKNTFFGPVGGAQCLLKWCFNCPSMTMAHTINKRPVGAGGKALGEGVQEEKKGGEEKKADMDVLFYMHVAIGRNQLLLHVRAR